MTDQRDETIDVLESLLSHPGWALLTSAVRREWAERERDGRDKALQNDDALALSLLRQVVASQKAVEWVLAWPTQELAKRRRLEHGRTGPPPDSDELLTLMSRRGSL